MKMFKSKSNEDAIAIKFTDVKPESIDRISFLQKKLEDGCNVKSQQFVQ